MRTPSRTASVRRSSKVARPAVGLASSVAPTSPGTPTAIVSEGSAPPQSGDHRGEGRVAGPENDTVRGRRRSELPDSKTRHVLSRFSGGVSLSRISEVAALGGIDAWFEQQLAPAEIPDHQADVLKSWFPTLGMTPSVKWEQYRSGLVTPSQIANELASWITLRRIISKRAVLEMMVDFWSNLVHVASPQGNLWIWRDEYEEMLRDHALGRFDDLLNAAITHPCMGMYQNNVESTALAMNENLGRELLELHTVGVGNYSEDDMFNSARILTGFHLDAGKTWAQSYVASDHWIGHVQVLGFSSSNTKPDGRPVLRKYLSYLAHHPATASRLCRMLAVRFVMDHPSDEFVDSLAQVYLESDTDIVPVLRALVASSEFQGSALQKVRTPVEDAVATWTALQVTVAQPHTYADAANQLVTLSRGIGQVVYDWPTPDAFPDLAPAWLGSGRMLGSMAAHWMGASGTFPTQGITYQPPTAWLPQLPTTFNHVVDYVVRATLFLPSTPSMLAAACLATGCQAYDVIDELNPLTSTNFSRLMVSILDTPEHMSR